MPCRTVIDKNCVHAYNLGTYTSRLLYYKYNDWKISIKYYRLNTCALYIKRCEDIFNNIKRSCNKFNESFTNIAKCNHMDMFQL